MTFMNKITVILLALFAFSQPALAQGGKKSTSDTPVAEAVELEQCPSDARDIDDFLNCECEAGGSLGSVWGTGLYTADSNLCTAATHAGAISESGGPVVVTIHPGQDDYAGSTQNNVTTNDWGSYGESFEVRALSGGATTADHDDTGLPRCAAMPPEANYYSCACPSDVTIGSVWGSGPYTTDSDICSAALHSGYIEAGEGSTVYTIRVQGLETYYGQESFGVTSLDWGAFDSSFVFDWNR